MIRHFALVGPTIFWSEDTLQTANQTTIVLTSGISLLNSDKSLYQALTHILRYLTYILPMFAIRNTDRQVKSLHLGILLTTFRYESRILLIIHIADALEKQQRKDIFFVSCRIDLTTKVLRSRPKEGFQCINSNLCHNQFLIHQFSKCLLCFANFLAGC